jgi:hypothetical protein
MAELEYSDRILYFHENYEIRDIATQKILLSRDRKSLKFPDAYHCLKPINHDKNEKMAVGYDKGFTIITTHQKSQCGRNFKITKYDKELNRKGVKLCKKVTITKCSVILHETIGKLPFNEESIAHHLSPDIMLPCKCTLNELLEKKEYTSDLRSIFYDKFDDKIITIAKNDMKYDYDMAVWTKMSDGSWWAFKRYLWRIPSQQIYLNFTFDQTFCTRKYIIVNFVTKDYWSYTIAKTIFVFDKNSLQLIDSFDGSHPVYIDDYLDWIEDNVKLLCGMACLGRMSEALLKIILLYVA